MEGAGASGADAAAPAEPAAPAAEPAAPLADDGLVHGPRQRRRVQPQADYALLLDEALYEDAEDDGFDDEDAFAPRGKRPASAAAAAAQRAKRVRATRGPHVANPAWCFSACMPRCAALRCAALSATRARQAKKESASDIMEADVARGVGFDPYSLWRVGALGRARGHAPAALTWHPAARRSSCTCRRRAATPWTRTRTASSATTCVRRIWRTCTCSLRSRVCTPSAGAHQVARGRQPRADGGGRVHADHEQARHARKSCARLSAQVRRAPRSSSIGSVALCRSRGAEAHLRGCVWLHRHGFINFGMVAHPPLSGPIASRGTVVIVGAGLAGLAAARQLQARRARRDWI
jgi:hypothetical protein